jgi:cytoskeleton protein RodZ
VEAPDDAPELPTLGQTFADERERQGLSRAEVAQRLHMSAWQIEALEGSDFSRLPQGTFLRGFVRNYARALGLNAEAALDRLAESAPRGPSPRIVVPSQNIRFDPIGDRLANPYVKAIALGVVFIAFGFAVMYWWLFIRPTPPAAAAAKKAAEQVVPQNLAAAQVAPPEPVAARSAPAETATSQPARPEPAKPEDPKKARAPIPDWQAKAAGPAAPAATLAAPPSAPMATPASASSAPPAKAEPRKASDRTLKLRFKGESWVEIKDRSGRVLLSRLNPPGSQAEVSGRPPFNVIIGNAPDVQVLYDDREFPLEPHTRVAVARFTVE